MTTATNRTQLNSSIGGTKNVYNWNFLDKQYHRFAIASLFTLEDKFGIHRITNLLVISIPWNYRRAMLTLKTYYPEWINYTWCPADYKQHQPNNWWKYPEAHGYVMKEINNLVKFVREGQLMDIEVEI